MFIQINKALIFIFSFWVEPVWPDIVTNMGVLLIRCLGKILHAAALNICLSVIIYHICPFRMLVMFEGCFFI
jgi:hypothetical protein